MYMIKNNTRVFIVVILLSSSREGETAKEKKVKLKNIENYNKNDDTSDTNSKDISASEDTTESNRGDVLVSYEILRGNPKGYEDPVGVESILTIHLESKNPNDFKDNSRSFKRIDIPPVNKMVGDCKMHPSSVSENSQVPKPVSMKKLPVFNDSVSEDEEEPMEKEILRAKALRQKYGDACYRVVRRKCLKAMKATLKDVCKSRGRKCARNFKDAFKENAITGCNMQFGNRSSQYRQGNDEPVQTATQFTDFTRQGYPYLSMTCLRTLSETNEQSETIDKSKPANVDAAAQNVNILRDRYERACQKVSYDKCCVAGKYASDQTCGKLECIKDKKKAIKLSYKRRCRDSYGYIKRDSSSGGSSESGSNESDSGSDSKESESD